MGSINKVILVGRVIADPETRTFQSGASVVNFVLATSEKWKDKATGEQKEKTEWNRISIFNERIADFATKYVKKGANLYIEGALETRKWTDKKSGVEKYSTDVVLRAFRGELVMIDSLPSSKKAEPKQVDLPLGPPGKLDNVAADIDDSIPF